MTWEQLVWLSNIRIAASFFVIVFALYLVSDMVAGLIEFYGHDITPRWVDVWDVAIIAVLSGIAYRHFTLFFLLLTDRSYADGPWVRYALKLTPPTILLALCLAGASIVRYNRHNPDFFLVRWWRAWQISRRTSGAVLDWKHDE